MAEQTKTSNDTSLGVPPSEFHPQRPPAPFKKRGNVRTAILVAILIIIVDLLIYFFLLKPDDTQLMKAIEPLKPPEATIVPTAPLPSQAESVPSQARTTVSDQAKADLAKRLQISVQEISVVSEEPVSWSDGSLGCPKPGMMYTQAIVEGTKVVLSAQNKNYDYHAGGTNEPFLCEKFVR